MIAAIKGPLSKNHFRKNGNTVQVVESVISDSVRQNDLEIFHKIQCNSLLFDD